MVVWYFHSSCIELVLALVTLRGNPSKALLLPGYSAAASCCDYNTEAFTLAVQSGLTGCTVKLFYTVACKVFARSCSNICS